MTAYHIYWDGGNGSIDYVTPLATVDGAANTWSSAFLTAGRTYLFGLRAEKDGIEESNTSLVVTLTVPEEPYAGAVAVIRKPCAGARITGNRLTVKAELVRGDVQFVKNVTFQYRKAGDSEWTLIPAAVVPHPNPDPTPPYKIHWDISQLAEGNYEIRALCVNNDNTYDPDPPIKTLTIDHHRPQLHEGFNKRVHHWIYQRIFRGKRNKVEFTVAHHRGSFEATVDQHTSESDTYIVADNPRDAEMADKLTGQQSIGRFLRLHLASGQKQFSNGREVTLAIPYADEDDDGIVDGTAINAVNLTLLWYNPAGGKWENSGISDVYVDLQQKVVRGKTSHFSTFGIMADGTDTDGDGLTDAEETSLYGTNPDDPDTDADGMPDGWEVANGLNPLANDAWLDPDGDGIGNLNEFLNGLDPQGFDDVDITPVPIHGGWWIISGLLTGLLVYRRKMSEKSDNGHEVH